MSVSIKSMNGFPVGILSAMIVTASLFVTLPLLTRLQLSPSTQTNSQPVLIDKSKPSPPPPAERDAPKTQTMPPQKIIETADKPERVQPKVDIPRGNSLMGLKGAIEIGNLSTVYAVSPISDPTYRPEEVDQPPRLLRSFPPQYPYIANRDSIEGWVLLRFVVDIEGVAKKVEVLEADPAGIFEEAAMKAVARYKFKPAMKNGEGVNCITKQRIRFTLD